MKKNRNQTENLQNQEPQEVELENFDIDEEIAEEKPEEPVQEDKTNEYLEMAQRIQAEFDNYRRRNQDSVFASRQDGIAYAVEMLLPVVDSINSAKRQVKDEEFLKSLELVYSQTLSCFEKLGVKKIDAINHPFNPEFHNAIMAEEVDGVEADTVIEEYQEGFEINGKVIRYSVVKVSK